MSATPPTAHARQANETFQFIECQEQVNRKLKIFLGASAKLLKATISFVMSVRPPARLSAWNNSTPTGRIFIKFYI
jgi:hypothetical protein